MCRGRERDGWGINMAQLRGYSSWGSTVIAPPKLMAGHQFTKPEVRMYASCKQNESNSPLALRQNLNQEGQVVL